MLVTKKELLEGGWIDQYVLGLTSEEESGEIERLAALYPDVQEQINAARHKVCKSFNRNLTQPALRHSFLSKRRILYGSAAIVFVALTGLAFLFWKHFYLMADYHDQCARLAEQEAQVDKLAQETHQVHERSRFVNASTTSRIKIPGCESTPDAEVILFQCKLSGKTMLQVIDLPPLPTGHHYEVWAQYGGDTTRMIGMIEPPIKYDSLYVLDTALHYSKLQITDVDPVHQVSEPVCLASVRK